MRSFFILCVVVATTTPARADSESKARAARALFVTQVRALNDGKLDAFVNAFVDSDSANAMFPASRFVSTGREAIRTAVKEWAGVGREPTAATVVGTPIVSLKSDKLPSKRSSRLVDVTGDLEVTVKGQPKPITLRMTEVYSDGLDKTRAKGLVVAAAFLTEPIENKDLRGEEVLATNTVIDPFLDTLRFPDLINTRFDGEPDDLVIGSSAGERAQGAEATKLLKTWSALKLVIVGKPQIVAELDWVYLMATVSLSRGKSQKPVPLNVLLVGYPQCLATPCTGKNMIPHLVALHFGQAR